MDIEQFTAYKSGILVPITTRTGHKDHAFIPEHLPGKFRMSSQLWPLVSKARQMVGSLEQIKGILPNPVLLLRPLQRREAIHSSMLEGTFTTAEQLLLYEHALNDSNEEPKSSSEVDIQEVHNYYEALRQGHNWIKDGKPINEELIKQLHRVLMTGVRGGDKTPGAFRTVQAYVGSGRKFIPAPPDALDKCISSFMEYLASDDDTFDPLVRAYVTHYQFEAIHPFLDGNGRVGRLLLALCVAKWCDLSMPWLYMSEYFDRHRHEYITLLFRMSSNGEWDEWIKFCLQGTIEQVNDALERCTRLQRLQEDYKERLKGYGNRMHAIVDMLFEAPIIQAADVRDKCDVSYETARVDISKLAALGILEKIDGRYPKTFKAREIVDIAYGIN